MSTQTLKQVATGQRGAVAAQRPNTIAGLLADPKVKQQMSLCLPKHVTADRLARVALTEVRKNPKLGEADQSSFLGAIMQCAALGIEPGGALGHAYLLPFENKRKGTTEVQFILGYKGMLDLSRRSGQILSIESRAVHQADHFSVSMGLNPDLQHVPNWDADDRGDLRFVYAVAKLKDGGTQFEVMSRKEVERIRNESQGYKTAIRFGRTDNPWISHFEEMAKKTVMRKLFKWLPISIELATAIHQDEAVDIGMPQDNPLTFDADTGEITGGAADQTASTPEAKAEPSGAPSMADHADFLAQMDAAESK
jgi:recombination protein RecT